MIQNCPQIVNTPYSPEKMKEVMSKFLRGNVLSEILLLIYYSGVELRTATCDQSGCCRSGFSWDVLC